MLVDHFIERPNQAVLAFGRQARFDDFSFDVQRLNDKQSFVRDHLRLTEVLMTGTDAEIDAAVIAHVLWMEPD